MWYEENQKDVADFEKQMRRKVHYVIEPDFLWGNIVHLAKTQNGELLNTLQKGFKYIEEESFQSNFQGLFSEINLTSDKLGRKYADRNSKLCSIISEIARGLAITTDSDRLGDAYEYLLGQFAAGSGKKAGEFYTPQQISSILSGIVTLDSQEPTTGTRDKLDSVLDFACGSGSLLLNIRHRMKESGGTIGKIYGQEYNVPVQTIPFAVATDVVEVLVYDSREGPMLAGVIELVSPANKDRAAHRQAFVSKCESYLQSGAGLLIVDIVTGRRGSLHDQLLDRLDPAAIRIESDLYVSAYRSVERNEQPALDIWQQPLAIGAELPTMPLFLTGGLCLPVDLEGTYQRTCREQRIPVLG